MGRGAEVPHLAGRRRDDAGLASPADRDAMVSAVREGIAHVLRRLGLVLLLLSNPSFPSGIVVPVWWEARRYSSFASLVFFFSIDDVCGYARTRAPRTLPAAIALPFFSFPPPSSQSPSSFFHKGLDGTPGPAPGTIAPKTNQPTNRPISVTPTGFPFPKLPFPGTPLFLPPPPPSNSPISPFRRKAHVR